MKNNLKNYLKIGTLLVGVAALLWNCRQQDDLTPVEIVQEKKIKTISFNDFKNEITHNKSFTSISRYFDINQVSKKSSGYSKSSENNLILTNKIIKVAKDEGTSYTFQLLKTEEGNEFYNLVVDVDRYGNIQKSVIFEYIPSNSWLADPSQAFSGDVSVQSHTVFSNDEILNSGNAAKTDGCYEAVYEWECNAGNDHAPNTCTAGGSDLIITILEVACDDAYGSGVSIPAGDGNTSSGPGGGGGSANGNNGPNPDSTMTSPVGPGDSTIIDNAFFDDQVFIDDSFKNNPCLKSVYDAMGKATKFSEYLYNFELGSSVADLRFKYDENFEANYAEYTDALAITEPPQNYVIDIIFNGDSDLDASIHNKPKLVIAVAFIHEMIHAEIFRKMLSAAQLGNLDTTGMTQQEQINFVNNLRNNFPGLYDYYVERWREDWGHQLMAQHYVSIIVSAISEYDNNAHSQATYEALAWIGLYDTIAWNNLTPEQQNDHINNKNTFIQNDTDTCN